MTSSLGIFKRTCEKESSTAKEGSIKGHFPDWLKGSLLRNGPGAFRVGKDEYNHLFDGLALIHKFGICNGRVTYQSHFLRSDTYKKNMQANRIVVSEFGTHAFPDPCKTLYQRLMSLFVPADRTDNDLIHVTKYADEIYACTETQFIRKIDVEEMQSLDKVDISDYVSVFGATAHPHYSTDGSVYNIGSGSDSGRPATKIIKFPIKKSDREMFENASVVCSVPSESRFYINYYHSFGMTENYIILADQPLFMSLLGLAASQLTGSSYEQSLCSYPNKEAVFHIVKRSTGELLPNKYTCKPFFVFHHINAFEDDGHIVVDLCAYDDAEIIKAAYLKNINDPSFDSKIHCVPVRYVLPLEVTQSEKGSPNNLNKLDYSEAKVYFRSDGKIECHHEDLTTDKDLFFMELPTINYEHHNGRKYQYSYGIANFSSTPKESYLVKVDTKTKTLKKWNEPNAVPSEAVFVPKPNSSAEDDGILLFSVMYRDDENKVSLVALEAHSFEEIGRADFVAESAVTGTFHGLFIKRKLP